MTHKHGAITSTPTADDDYILLQTHIREHLARKYKTNQLGNFLKTGPGRNRSMYLPNVMSNIEAIQNQHTKFKMIKSNFLT